MDKKCKAILLPANNGNFLQSGKEISYFNNSITGRKSFNLYILSDDKIKENDWYIDDANQIRKSITSDFLYWSVRSNYKKIIATTNPNLIKEGVASIDRTFIQEYCNNPVEEVLVEYQTLYDIELLFDTDDFPKGSLIRGLCDNTNDFGFAKRRFMELHTDGNELSIAIEQNTIKSLYKKRFKTVEIKIPKLSSNGSIIIKPIEETWDDIYDKMDKWFNYNEITPLPILIINWLKNNYEIPKRNNN